MNICLFNNFFPPKTGGSSHYTYDLSRELAKKRNKVVVITSKLYEGQPDFEVKEGVRIYRLKSATYPALGIAHGFDLRFSLFPSNLMKIWRILQQEKIEVVHTQGQFFDLVVPSAVLSKMLGIPSVLSIHTRVEHTNPAYNLVLSVLDLTAVRLIAGLFDRIIALDKPCFDYIRSRYGFSESRVPFIQTGVRIPKKARSARKGKTILWVSHITDLKDPTPLILAIPDVLKKHPDARFVFIGKVCKTAPVYLARKLGVDRNVEFLGEQPFEAVLGWFSKSLIEGHDLNLGLGMGSATLEAMGVGMCVLSAAKKDNFFGTTPKDMEEIVFVKKNDPKDIASKLIFLLSNPRKAEMIGKNAEKYVKTNFRWEMVADRFERLYASLKRSRREKP